MIKYDVYPTVCNVCHGKVEYKRMEDIGIEPYQSGFCYACKDCGAYVGTHKKQPKIALGILGTGTERYLRLICHEEFDKHWVSLAGKNRAYYRLSKELGIKSEDCHFGHFNKEMLLKALDVMQEMGNFR